MWADTTDTFKAVQTPPPILITATVVQKQWKSINGFDGAKDEYNEDHKATTIV